MNKAILLAGLAGAASAFAVPAQAATTVSYPTGTNVGLVGTPDGQTLAGAFTAAVTGTGAFSTAFTFSVPMAGTVSIAGLSILTSPASNIDFTSGMLDGSIPFTIRNGFVDLAELSMQSIGAGSHSFTLSGTLNPTGLSGSAAIGGNLSFALMQAVPEPATWALFILGFAAIGGTMRRRVAQTQMVKAAIRFA